MKKLLLNSALLMLTLWCSAQRFKYKADVDPSDSSGFYQIILDPEIIARSAASLSDLRLIDDSGKEVPYLIKEENRSVTLQSFIEFPILARQRTADSLTHVVISNQSLYQVGEMLITFANTGANRFISIRGSNDGVNWFIIRENIGLEKTLQENNRFVQAVPLPQTNYRYYSIAIDGKNLVPVNILRAGINTTNRKNGAYQLLPVPGITPAIRNKTSYIDLLFPEKYQIDELKLYISAPRFFRRDVSVYGGDTLSPLSLGAFTINSQQETIILVRAKTNRIRLVVDNLDNPPLTLDSVQAFQLNKYLVAFFEKGGHELRFGDSAANAPQYDLAFFADSTRSSIKTLGTNGVIPIPPSGKEDDDASDNRLVLWLVIGVVLAIMLTITIKMASEVKKRNSGAQETGDQNRFN